MLLSERPAYLTDPEPHIVCQLGQGFVLLLALQDGQRALPARESPERISRLFRELPEQHPGIGLRLGVLLLLPDLEHALRPALRLGPVAFPARGLHHDLQRAAALLPATRRRDGDQRAPDTPG